MHVASLHGAATGLLADHVVAGRVTDAAASLLTAMVDVVSRTRPGDNWQVEDFVVSRPLVVAADETREVRMVVTTHGMLDDATVDALLQAIGMTDEEAPIVLDLADAGELHSTRELGLLSTLAFRAGRVTVRGAHRHHRQIVAAAKASA